MTSPEGSVEQPATTQAVPSVPSTAARRRGPRTSRLQSSYSVTSHITNSSRLFRPAVAAGDAAVIDGGLSPSPPMQGSPPVSRPAGRFHRSTLGCVFVGVDHARQLSLPAGDSDTMARSAPQRRPQSAAAAAGTCTQGTEPSVASSVQCVRRSSSDRQMNRGDGKQRRSTVLDKAAIAKRWDSLFSNSTLAEFKSMEPTPPAPPPPPTVPTQAGPNPTEGSDGGSSPHDGTRGLSVAGMEMPSMNPSEASKVSAETSCRTEPSSAAVTSVSADASCNSTATPDTGAPHSAGEGREITLEVMEASCSQKEEKVGEEEEKPADPLSEDPPAQDQSSSSTATTPSLSALGETSSSGNPTSQASLILTDSVSSSTSSRRTSMKKRASITLKLDMTNTVDSSPMESPTAQCIPEPPDPTTRTNNNEQSAGSRSNAAERSNIAEEESRKQAADRKEEAEAKEERPHHPTTGISSTRNSRQQKVASEDRKEAAGTSEPKRNDDTSNDDIPAPVGRRMSSLGSVTESIVDEDVEPGVPAIDSGTPAGKQNDDVDDPFATNDFGQLYEKTVALNASDDAKSPDDKLMPTRKSSTGMVRRQSFLMEATTDLPSIYICIKVYMRFRAFVTNMLEKIRGKGAGKKRRSSVLPPGILDLDVEAAGGSTDWLYTAPVKTIFMAGVEWGSGVLRVSKSHLSIGRFTGDDIRSVTLNAMQDATSPKDGVVVIRLAQGTSETDMFAQDLPSVLLQVEVLNAREVVERIFRHQAAYLRLCASVLHRSLIEAKPRVLHIAHFNDVYHLPPFKPATCKALVGGASRFHTALAKIRQNCNPLVLFSGDFMGPSLLSVLTKGKQMVDALNFLGVHYGCFGNHEFDYGLKTLRDVVHGYTQGKHIFCGSQTKWIMTNMEGADGKPLCGAKRYELCTWNGIRVGIIGLCENWLPQCSKLRPGEAKYLDIFETGERYARELKSQGAEVVLALTHNRYPLDRELTQRCPSIDYLLGGHDHFYKSDPKNRIVKSGQEFEYLTFLEAKIGPEEGQMKWRNQCIPITSHIPESDYMTGLIHRYEQRMEEKMGKVIGDSPLHLDSTEECIRFKEGHLSNFIVDIMMDSASADFAVLGGAAIAGKDIKEPGKITIGDVFAWFPNETRVMKLKLRGSTIVKMLNAMVKEVPAEAPSFPHPSRTLFFTINTLHEETFVEDVHIHGRPIAEGDWYSAAVEDFVGKGKAKYKFVPVEGTKIVDEEDAPQLVDWVIDFFNKPPDVGDGTKLGANSEEDVMKNLLGVLPSFTRMSVTSDIAQSQRLVRSLICEVLKCDRASIFIHDSAKGEVYFTPEGGTEVRFANNIGLVGVCVQQRAPLNIPDAYEDSRFNKAVDMKTGYRTRSVLAVPVISDGEDVLAVVQAINKENNGVFEDLDEAALRLLGEQVCIQMHNISLYREMQEEASYSSDGTEAAAGAIFKNMAANSSMKLSENIVQLSQYAREIVPSQSAGVFVWDPESERLYTEEQGLDDDMVRIDVDIRDEQSLAAIVARSGQPKLVNGAAKCAELQASEKGGERAEISWVRSMGVPIWSAKRKRLVGVAVWINKKSQEDYTLVDAGIADYFARFCGQMIPNAQRLEIIMDELNPLPSVPVRPLGRIKFKGGWATVRRHVRDGYFRRASRIRGRLSLAATPLMRVDDGQDFGGHPEESVTESEADTTTEKAPSHRWSKMLQTLRADYGVLPSLGPHGVETVNLVVPAGTGGSRRSTGAIPKSPRRSILSDMDWTVNHIRSDDEASEGGTPRGPGFRFGALVEDQRVTKVDNFLKT